MLLLLEPATMTVAVAVQEAPSVPIFEPVSAAIIRALPPPPELGLETVPPPLTAFVPVGHVAVEVAVVPAVALPLKPVAAAADTVVIVPVLNVPFAPAGPCGPVAPG